MKYRKALSIFLAALIMMSGFAVTSHAADLMLPGRDSRAVLVTSEFSVNVPANTVVQSNTTFSLDDGDTVVITAAFTPRSASVDFGIVAPNGQFYHVNVTGGVADIAIDITRRGNYAFAIRNNSSSVISVSGYLNY